MPPGVTTDMIPGNRPDDLKEDAFWQAFGEKLAQQKVVIPEEGELVEQDTKVDLWNSDLFCQAVTIARDMGSDDGYQQGQNDELMAQSAFECELAERMNAWLEDHPRASAKQYLRQAAEVRRGMNADD